MHKSRPSLPRSRRGPSATPHEAGPLKPILGGLPGSVCSSRSVVRAGPPGCCSWKCTAHAPVLCSASCLCRRVPKASTARRLPPYAPPLSADPCLFPIWGCRVGRCWEHFCTYGGVGAGNKSSHLGKYPGVGLLLGHRVNCFKSKNIGVWGVPGRSAVNTSSSKGRYSHIPMP